MIALNLEKKTVERFSEYAAKAGQTKTTALERIINSYLDEYDKAEEEKKESED
ncbi:hypothetical protein [uncultured Faecalibaculum sp.]|nr:hypothetical protein [uncultured Faecalibaculum sp.]